MQFRQNKNDGSCDMIFTEEEIEIIKRNKKLHFPAISLRHIGNALVKMVADWQLYFNDELKNKETREDDIVEGK